jgi:putative ABC transport system permease protein
VAVMIRSSGRPESDMVRMEREIQRVDSDLAVFALQSLNQVVAKSTAQRRFALSLISIFALTALTLAGLGVYGITAFGVAQRTREIGIRIALGATRSQLLAMILGRGVRLTLAGLLAGYLVSALLTRFLQGFLFGITGADVLTYLGATALLSAVMLLACYLPARRAVRLDAARALRQE